MAARLNKVTRARKSPGTCGRCGAVINIGDGYYYWKFRFGRRQIRCLDHAPAPWERESNSKRQDLMRASDAFAACQNADAPEDAAASLREAIGYVESARDEFQNAVDGWSSTGLENSEMAQNFEYAVSDLDDWLSDAEQAADELEAWDPTDPDNADDPDAWQDVIIGNLGDVPDPDF